MAKNKDKTKKNKKNKNKHHNAGRKAESADRHELYQKSVQDPDAEITLLSEKFQQLKGRQPLSLREDFCGTAFLSVAWCQQQADHTALGIDLCEDTLAWGRQHNLEPAGEDVVGRVRLVHANVLDPQDEKVDLTCAFNFSYQIFNTREQMLGYLKMARAGLKDDGVLVMDIYGGTEAIDVLEEDREVEDEDFEFIWEQEKFNPINHHMTCHIHFRFDDGSELKNAFTYEWRLWSIPELSELLLEAGFSKVHVFWEEYIDTDDDDDYLESTGDYVEVTEVENQESWVSYIFAEA